MMSLIKNFQIYGDSLTELETECFNKLLGFNDLVPSLTISSLAKALNVSTTTVFRMVKKLNYKTFMEFRYDLIYQRHDKYGVEEKKDGTLHLMENEIQDTLDMLHNVDISAAIKCIMKAKSVMICSSGMNKYVAKILAIKLSLYRIRTIYPDDQWFLYLEANNLTVDDFVIVLSRGGNTDQLVRVIQNVKVSGCKILLITTDKQSKIAKMSDFVMTVSMSEDEGYDIDSRLHLHIGIEYLLRELKRNLLSAEHLQGEL